MSQDLNQFRDVRDKIDSVVIVLPSDVEMEFIDDEDQTKLADLQSSKTELLKEIDNSIGSEHERVENDKRLKQEIATEEQVLKEAAAMLSQAKLDDALKTLNEKGTFKHKSGEKDSLSDKIS